MTDENLYKLSLYDLLYTYPTCNYSQRGLDGYMEINIMFIGSKDKAVQTFQTIFWAAQYPKARIRLTLAMSQGECSAVQGILQDNSRYPELDHYREKGYIEKVCYIPLKYKEAFSCDDEASIREIVTDDIERLSPRLMDNQYIIIATGDPFCDYFFISGIKAKKFDSFVAVYDRALSNKIQVLDSVQFEKTEKDFLDSDLLRAGQNVNVSYNIKYNQRLSIAADHQHFQEKLEIEYSDSPTDSYDVDSSLACAVHIPYKLAYCEEYGYSLAEAIQEKNDLYNRLIALEHRRWNAYMIMLGYRGCKGCYDSSVKGWQSELFVDGKKPQVNVKDKIHACICDCHENGLNSRMKEKSFWKNSPAKLSELDRVSWSLHKEADKRTKALAETFWVENGILTHVYYKSLRKAIESLLEAHDDANEKYAKAYAYAKEHPKSIQDLPVLDKIHQSLQIVIFRNRKVDFFSHDAQLLQLLPFCSWYGKYYNTVVVFSEGIAASDIIIPTLLLAPKVIIVYDSEKVDEGYKRRIELYFKGRGNNTQVVFMTSGEASKHFPSHKGGSFVLEEYNAESSTDFVEMIPLAYDVSNQTIIGPSQFKGLEKQSISVQEYLRLIGGDMVEGTNYHFPDPIYSGLEKLFWDHIKEEKGKLLWNCYLDLLVRGKSLSSHEQIILEGEPDTIRIFRGSFHISIYRSNRLDLLLMRMHDMHLISHLKIIQADQYMNIEFLTYYEAIKSNLSRFTVKGDKNLQKRKHVYFYPFKEGQRDLLFLDGFTYEMDYINKDGMDLTGITSFYEQLCKLNICSNLVKKEKVIQELQIMDLKTAAFFSQAGNMFEYVVYRRMLESGLFDDVEMGVKILWGKQKTKQDKELLLHQKMDEVCTEEPIGLASIRMLQQARKHLFHNQNVTQEHDNEIDLIAVRGMKAYMISCKCIASSQLRKAYIDEIRCQGERTGAKSVLALVLPKKNYIIRDYSQEHSEQDNLSILEDDLFVIGRESLENSENFYGKMDAIIKNTT